MLKNNGTTQMALKGANAQLSGSPTQFYSGALPSGWDLIHKQGAMVKGYPSDATDAAVQANIAGAGYATSATATPSTPDARVSVQATTSCCTSDYLRHDDVDTKVVVSAINSASPTTDKADATWIVRAGLADSSCISLEPVNFPAKYIRHYAFTGDVASNGGTNAWGHHLAVGSGHQLACCRPRN